MHFVLPIISQ